MKEQYAYFFSCFSHKSRNEILRLLAQNGEMTVESIASEMKIQASTVSRHLGMLKLQGVVNMRVEAPSHYYHLNKGLIEEKFTEFLQFLKL